MSKLILCQCEDVTEADLREAVAHGYRDIESTKRYTGFGTGFCQGKSCVAPIAQWLHQHAGVSAEQLAPFTPRPPLQPTELGLYAGLDLELTRDALSPHQAQHGDDGGGGTAGAWQSFASREPLPESCSVAIVGGGILGLALAYNLAKRGQRDVLVLEESYLCGGASGRNGGGVRAQWNTVTNIRLARRSLELMDGFAAELGLNVWLRRGGYLFLAKTERIAERLAHATELHQRNGLRTELRSVDGVRELVPELDLSGVVGAAWNPDDGVVFPWPFVWGYARGATRLGARVEPFTRVTGVRVEGARVRAVETSRGTVRCDVLVNAAGAWSPQVAALAGITLPNQPHRHEMASAAELPQAVPRPAGLGARHWPLLLAVDARGDRGGHGGIPDELAGLNQQAQHALFAGSLRPRTHRASLPRARQVKVVRQWAGCYDVTPDNSPILGETPGLAGFLQLSGFVGHGLMMAPAVAEAMATWMAGGPRDEIFDRYNLGRFAEGRLEQEDMIIAVGGATPVSIRRSPRVAAATRLRRGRRSYLATALGGSSSVAHAHPLRAGCRRLGRQHPGFKVPARPALGALRG